MGTNYLPIKPSFQVYRLREIKKIKVDKKEEDEMGGACSTNGGEEECI
jgi:hypothetical protein